MDVGIRPLAKRWFSYRRPPRGLSASRSSRVSAVGCADPGIRSSRFGIAQGGFGIAQPASFALVILFIKITAMVYCHGELRAPSHFRVRSAFRHVTLRPRPLLHGTSELLQLCRLWLRTGGQALPVRDRYGSIWHRQCAAAHSIDAAFRVDPFVSSGGLYRVGEQSRARNSIGPHRIEVIIAILSTQRFLA